MAIGSLRVADVALANEHIRQVFQRVFNGGGVDGGLHLIGSDAFDGDWKLVEIGGRHALASDHDLGRFAVFGGVSGGGEKRAESERARRS